MTHVCANLSNFYVLVTGQANMFATTLYDAIYMYLKIANEVLKEGKTTRITDGAFMYQRAKNYRTKSGEQAQWWVRIFT